MAISNRDREILLRQINRLLIDTPTLEVGDVARVIENTGTSLRKGSVATVTKVLSENEVSVTTRHHDGQESFGVIPNNQLQKVEPLGEDIDGNQVNLYDLVEGVGDHFNGDLMLVVGVDEDGVGIAHPVKIRLKPVVETHLDYRIPLDQSKLTTMDEWCEPRVGDVVETTRDIMAYLDPVVSKAEYGIITSIVEGSSGLYTVVLPDNGWDSNNDDGVELHVDDIKTVLRR